MKSLHIVLLLVFGLTIAQVHDNRALWELRDMIICANPDSRPILDYSDYGCYCGFGGYGTPVDDLDRCCQVHDYCYKAAKMLPNCNPYLKSYSYICDKANKTVTCQSNSECGMFVCECDKTIAECFAVNTYNKEHNHLPNEYCN